MTALLKLGDSSTPPATWPAVDGWGFYIGGDTPHVWTAAEIAAAKLHVRYLLPIFTRSNPAQASPAADAAAAIASCLALGLPPGKLVGFDLEAAVAPAYVTTVDRLITAAGWRLAIYGELATVLNNSKPSGGYWVGDWDGVDADPSWTGKQYTDAGPYDLSEFDTPDLWDTRPPTPTPPAAPDTIEEDEMSTTSVNGRAGLSWAAGSRHVVQATCDPGAAGDKAFTLRGVLVFPKTPATPGAFVFQLTVDSGGTGNYEIPETLRATCRGVILEGAGTPVFDATAV